MYSSLPFCISSEIFLLFSFCFASRKQRLESLVHLGTSFYITTHTQVYSCQQKQKSSFLRVYLFSAEFFPPSRSAKFLIRLSRAAPRTPGASGPGLAPIITRHILVDLSFFFLILFNYAHSYVSTISLFGVKKKQDFEYFSILFLFSCSELSRELAIH